MKEFLQRPSGAYLFVFNSVLCCAWSYCLYLALACLATGADSAAVYKAVEIPLKISQTVALVEILHSATGLVRNPVIGSVMQVTPKFLLLWGMLVPFKESTVTSKLIVAKFDAINLQLSVNFTTLLVAWCLNEIICYSYFASKALDRTPYALLWLRYTACIPLFPLWALSAAALVPLKQICNGMDAGHWSRQMAHRASCAMLLLAHHVGFAYFGVIVFIFLLWRRNQKLGGPHQGATRWAGLARTKSKTH